MYKVEGQPDLVRTKDGSIQNINTNEYHSFIHRRNAILENQKRMESLESDNKEIKQTLSQILELLRGIK